MARRYTIELLMNLAKSIGANPQKFMGTRSNITFLGKGPTKNPLFQGPVAGLEGATEAQLGSKESIIGAVEDAMGFASANKLNSIQIQALGLNLENILKIYKPPVLPMAQVTKFPERGSGITQIDRRHWTKEDIKLAKDYAKKSKEASDSLAKQFGYDNPSRFDKPQKTSIDRLFEGPITSTGPKGTRTWNFTKKSRLPETGPEVFNAALNEKTGMSRSIARQLLLQDTRLKLPEEVLISLRTGSKGPDPLSLMRKYYGKSMMNFDEWLDDIIPRGRFNENPRDLASRVLSEVELVPQFASGGLARILEV